MAKYGGFTYEASVGDGGKFYGGAAIPSLSVGTFEALVINYDQVEVTWSNPSGNFRRFRLIRNQEGIPDTEEDGIILYDAVTPPSSAALIDNGVDVNGTLSPLIEGRHVYYSIWLWLEDDDNRWYLAGTTYSTIPSPHSLMSGTAVVSTTHTRLLESLPKVMTSDDLNAFGVVNYDSDLSNFLKGMTFTADELLTLTDLLLPNATFINLTPELLNSYSLNFGIKPENDLETTPTKFQRMFLRNALSIYQEKGTSQALAKAVEALTGFDTQLVLTNNLMLTSQDATFYQGIGNWVSGAGATLTSSNDSADTEVPTTGEATDEELLRRIDDSYFGKVVTSGSNNVITNGATSPTTTAIPVEEGTNYVFSLYQKTDDSRTITMSVSWHDYLGNIIDTVDSGALNTTTDWSQISFDTGDAPEGSVYASLSLSFSAADTYYIDMINFALYTNVEFSEARGVGVIFSPTKRNYIENPSFETDTAGWSDTNATLTSTAFSTDTIPGQYSGDDYMLIESTSADDVTVSYTSSEFIIEPGTVTLSAFLNSVETPTDGYTATIEAYAVAPSSTNYVTTSTPTSFPTTGWTFDGGSGGSSSTSFPTTGGPSNGAHVLVDYTVQPTSGDQVLAIDSTGMTVTPLENADYTVSLYIKTPVTRSVFASVEWELYDASTVEESSDEVIIPADTWTLASFTFTAPSSVEAVNTVSLTFDRTGASNFDLAYAGARLSPVSYSSEETWLPADGAWSRESVSLNIPSDANFLNAMKVQFTLAYESNGEDVKIDAVQLELGEFVTDYFDGSFFNAVWDGGDTNAHDAISSMYGNNESKLAALQSKIRDYLPIGTPFWVENDGGVEFNGVFKYYA